MAIRIDGKFWLTLSAALAMASVAWFFADNVSSKMRRPRVPRGQGEGAAYAPAKSEVPSTSVLVRAWNTPAPQSRGAEWTYEVFAPPEIRFDRVEGRFYVASPVRIPNEEKGPQHGDLREITPNRTLFPLQLHGFIGEPGHVVGSFANPTTGEVFLAGGGAGLGEAGYTLKELSVEQRRVPMGDQTQAKLWVARAVVCDRDGMTTVLNSGEVAYVDNDGDLDPSAESEDGDEPEM